ncbi:sphingomyelin phosphodiesterase 4 [Arctopsyche grandis]|uniref:sphingomyelin phosphodiesterase 4 n=1 Tax=Arctopsyche grandis TaxID=121162 RepID=UPI00406D892D
MCALSDLPSRLEAILRAPLRARTEQLEELAITLPAKELQGLLPSLVSSIFGVDGRPSWGLRSTVPPDEIRILFDFLSPAGTIFKICYKLISDPQLKYSFPLRLLPVDVVHMLESGRIPQFYLDLVNVDPQTRQIISLSLNPFDYYMFHFAVHLYCTSYNRESWDAWNTTYYELSCEYLLHFLPSDINATIYPRDLDFTGKTPAVSHMQVTSRHAQFPSLLISQENVGCSGLSGSSTQLHPRGEIWRSETVLQVFIDVWLSIASQQELPQIDGVMCRNRSAYPASEHVRIARALIKQCHGFALGGAGDPTSLGELRRAVPGILSPRAHAHIRHLMHTWPLDSSFRLVLELWFSFIQPWRYIHMKDKKKGFSMRLDTLTEEQRPTRIDDSFIPFISENLLAYTEIFQLVVPRFLRLNLTVPKNATMLFRLTKVFSQTNLVQLLMEVENSVACDIEPMPISESTLNNKSSHLLNSSSPGKLDRTNSSKDSSNQQNWDSIDVTDAITPNQYRPLLLGGGRHMARDLLVYASQAYSESVEILKLREEQIKLQKRGIFSSIYYWFAGDNNNDEMPLEEIKKVPVYLSTSVSQLASIFSLDTNFPLNNESYFRNQNISGSFLNSSLPSREPVHNFNYNVLMSPKQAKDRINQIKYMGDPDLQPVKSFENAFLVRVLHQISSKMNEMYRREMEDTWNRGDVLGVLSKEVLVPPCVIHTYSKSSTHDSMLIRQTLPPRISLRYLASHSFMFWFILCFVISYSMGYRVFSFVVFIFAFWLLTVIFNAIVKTLIPSRNNT